jgi:alpha-tubulin suppressor-like RCC1 family protein
MCRQIAIASSLLAGCVGTAESVLEPLPPGDTTNTLSRDVIAIAAGQGHTCALNRDETIACWGVDIDGDVTVPPYGSFIAIDAGAAYTCALRFDRTIACWGSPKYSYDGVLAPPPGEFIAISSGLLHACGLRIDRTVACWGRNLHGESTPPPGTFRDVSAGGVYTCGVRDTGEIECWGKHDEPWGYGNPPTGSFVAVNATALNCGLDAIGGVTCWTGGGDPVEAPIGRFRSVSGNITGACAIRDDSTLACWTAHGEPVWPKQGRYVQLDSGPYHTCGVRDNGLISCWGTFDFGQVDPPEPTR